jgi:hypothetical protein
MNLSDPREVKAIQTMLRANPISEPIVMKFLEELCGWFDFHEEDKDRILMFHGKRQVLATLKTLLEFSPEQVAEVAKQKEL